MRIAVAVVALDGLQSLFSGVGVVVRSFVDHVDRIMAEALDGTGHEWSLSCATGFLVEGADNLRTDVRAATRAACERTGGSFAQLPSLADGRDAAMLYLGRDVETVGEQWAALSRAAARWLVDLAGAHDLVLALVHDTPLAAVGGALGSGAGSGAGAGAERVRLTWLPHSLGAVFPDRMAAARRDFEARSVADLIARGDSVGYVSTYYRDVLADRGGVPADRLMPFINVIDTAAAMYRQPPSDRARALLSGLPGDARLTFSWGRCKPQKGFDEILRAFRLLLESDPDGRDHLVLLAPTATTEPPYLETIRRLAGELPADRVTVCHDFDESLPLAVLRDPRLRSVVLASRFEAFGLVAAEAREFAPENAAILYAPIPTFDAVLADDPRAYRLSDVDAGVIAAALRDASPGRPVVGARATGAPGAAFVRSQATGVAARLRPILTAGAAR